jgi:competence protein ComEC
MRNILRRLFLSFASAFFLFINVSGQPGAVSGELRVYFLNVGQGDAILIQCPTDEHFAVIDAGELNIRYPQSATRFRTSLDSFFQSRRMRIDLLVASHPHSDHTASMAHVLQRFDVVKYLDNGDAYESSTYENLAALVRVQQNAGLILYETVESASRAYPDFCPATNVRLEVVRPRDAFDDCGDRPNNCSVLLRLTYGKTSFLFVGDAEEELEHKALADKKTRRKINVDVLKVGHHGSHTSSTLEFLKVVSPRIAVISVGEPRTGSNKGFKHPRAETISNLNKSLKTKKVRNNINVEAYDSAAQSWITMSVKQGLFLTSIDGVVTIASDGKKVWKAQ